MLYENSMWKLFTSSSPQEINMKLILYMIHMKLHKAIPHHPMKMMNFKIAKSIMLIRI